MWRSNSVRRLWWTLALSRRAPRTRAARRQALCPPARACEPLEIRLLPSTTALAVQPTAVTDPNTTLIPGEGTNALQFAPDGRLAQILWTGSPLQLVYRVRDGGGNWSQETVATSAYANTEGYGVPSYTPFNDNEQAQLLFTADDVPHILMLGQNAQGAVTISHYDRTIAGGWQLVETVLPFGSSTGRSVQNFTAAVGPNNALHVTLTYTDNTVSPAQSSLLYGTDASGSWGFQVVTTLGTDTPPLFPGAIAPRYLSLAVDTSGFAHIAFTPDFQLISASGGFSDTFSQLAYATNSSGHWTTQVVYQSPDHSGDAGDGASIAISPTGTISIASFFVERVATGSASYAELLYNQLQNDGTWSTQVVANASAGYAAADGTQFTGFAPQLEFDAQGQPNIAFADYASQHFSDGAHEFTGQIRYAVETGGTWNIQTVFQQTNPLTNQLFYPVMALSPYEADFEGLSRQTTQSPGDLGVGVSATYTLQMVALTLAPNPSPVLSIVNDGLFTFSENGPPIAVAPGMIAAFSGANFSGGNLTVTSAGNTSAHDVLTVEALAPIAVSGTTVTYNGTTIGTFSGGTGSTPLVIALNANATLPAVQSLVQAITFQTAGPSIDTAQRTLEFQLSDGSSHTSLPAFVPIGVYALQSSGTPERMYRLYNPNAMFHFFTTSQTEFQYLVSIGYHDESTNVPGFAVENSLITGVLPVHRMYNPNNGQHYYTYKDGERDFLVEHGWYYENDMGFIYTSQVSATFEVFVLYNSIGGEHLYLTDVNEKNGILASLPSWQQQTSFGFAYDVSASGVIQTTVIASAPSKTAPMLPAPLASTTTSATSTSAAAINGIAPATVTPQTDLSRSADSSGDSPPAPGAASTSATAATDLFFALLPTEGLLGAGVA